MSIDQSSLRMILTLLKMHSCYRFEGHVLVLGVQDIIASHEDVMGLLDELNFDFSPIPDRGKKYSTSRRHKEFSLLSDVKQLMHMDDLFKMLGFKEIDSLDAFDNDHPSILHDLNNPVPLKYHNKYDVIIDFGVLEHVFDIRQALENVISMLKVGGTVILCLPLMGWNSLVFYNFQPPLFFEAFGANGFDEMRLYINYYPKWGQVEVSKRFWREFQYNDEIPFVKAFHYTNNLFIARKVKKLESFVNPIQGFYVGLYGAEVEKIEQFESLATKPSFLDKIPCAVARFYTSLAPIYRLLPNWARTLILEKVLFKIKERKELASRKKFYF